MSNTAPTVTVESIMVTEVISALPDMKLREVAELMIKHQISGMPVVDTMGRLVSMIGEGDTLRLAASHGLESTLAQCLPKMISGVDLITLQKQETFTEAYRLFLKHKMHRIPIVDDSGSLKGLVTRSQILRLFIEAHYGKKIKARNIA